MGCLVGNSQSLMLRLSLIFGTNISALYAEKFSIAISTDNFSLPMSSCIFTRHLMFTATSSQPTRDCHPVRHLSPLHDLVPPSATRDWAFRHPAAMTVLQCHRHSSMTCPCFGVCDDMPSSFFAPPTICTFLKINSPSFVILRGVTSGQPTPSCLLSHPFIQEHRLSVGWCFFY